MPREPRKPGSGGARRTVHDVARVAGVSAGTVSRVTSNNPTVDPKIRERVLATIERLGYRPNAVAQSMRTASTKLIGCLVSDFSNPLYAAVLRSAEMVLAPAGYTLLVASTDDDLDREIALIEAFASRRVDGLIAVPSDERDPRLLRALDRLGVPLVLMERDIDQRFDAVATDHIGGTRRGTEHLLSLGHRRVALITGRTTTRSGRDRLQGYRDAFAHYAACPDAALIRCESLTTDYAFASTLQLLALAAPPTAIIAGGNRMLTGVLRGLALRGRSVPADVSVLSSGDTELAELAAPPVTVIRWDLSAFGREVAELLLSRLSHPRGAPKQIVLGAELVIRASCAAPSVSAHGKATDRPAAPAATPGLRRKPR